MRAGSRRSPSATKARPSSIGVWMMRADEEAIVARRSSASPGEGRPSHDDGSGRMTNATMTNYQLPSTNYQLPTTNYQLPATSYLPRCRDPSLVVAHPHRVAGRAAPRDRAGSRAGSPPASADVGACGSRRTCRRATTSTSRTWCRCRCVTASRCTPTSTGRSARASSGALSRTPYSTERFPTAYDAAVYFAQRGTSTCSRTCGGVTNRTASGSRSSTASATASTRSSGPPSSRGRPARSPRRAAPTSGRTSGARLRRRLPRW